VHERSWPQRFAGPKTADMAARQNSELVVHKAEDLVGGAVIALTPTGERAIDVVIVVTHLRGQHRLWRHPRADRVHSGATHVF
jgi:hypothetical protein